MTHARRVAAFAAFLVAIPAAAPQARELTCRIDLQAVAAQAESPPFMHETPPLPGAHRGLHGQLVFGAEAVHLHHLPFFLLDPGDHPHNFQVVLRAAFRDPDDRAAYLARRSAAPDALFTAAPPVFVQDALAEEGVLGRSLGVVDLFDEHFENSPRPAPFLQAEMIVEKVLTWREVDPGGPRESRMSYLVSAAGGEVFLIHRIGAPPDFDQVLAAAVAPVEIDTVDIAALDGGLLTVLNVDNAEVERLRPGETLGCTIVDGTRRIPVAVTVEAGREVYCEAGELSAPAGTDAFEGKRACAAE